MPEDELRPEYLGGGLRRQRRAGRVNARRQFDDATDQDIERLVREKWEAIDAARKVAVAAPNAARAEAAADGPVSSGLPANEGASPPAEPMLSALLPPASQYSDARLRRKREDDALFAVLAALA